MRRPTLETPCPVCGGYLDAVPPNRPCAGFSKDGKSWCTRSEFAGQLQPVGGDVFPHSLGDDCGCGKRHDPASDSAEVGAVSPGETSSGRSTQAGVNKRWKRRRRPPADGAPKDGRPEIEVREDDLTVLLAEAREAVRNYNAERTRVFRFGGMVCTVETTEDGAPSIRTLSPESMREVLAHAARWYRVRMVKTGESDPETGDTIRQARREDVKAPTDLARIMLASPSDVLPTLSRVTRAPLLAPSGRLVTEPGYDLETRVYLAPGMLRVAEIPDSPTPEEIAEARRLIVEELLGGFPFVGEADRAHAVGLVVLPFVREVIDGPTPLHLIEKPAPGSGASLLVEAASHVARGAPAIMLTEGHDEDEWRKRVTATLLGGPEMVSIDNVRRRLESAAFSAALTCAAWSDRRLGASETVTVPVRCAWVATGNNPAVSAEIARRCVSIRIDARVERPWERSGFRHPRLIEWVREHRGELVRAVLVLARAWVALGRPRSTASLGSYESWADVVGGVLDVAGVPGFLANRERFYARADREAAAWAAFVGAWWSRHGEARVGVRELWEIVESGGAEAPVDLGQGSERSQRTRLGAAVATAVDRRHTVEGVSVRVEAAGTRQGAAQYRLARWDDKSPSAGGTAISLQNRETAPPDGEPSEPCEPFAPRVLERARKSEGEENVHEVPQVHRGDDNRVATASPVCAYPVHRQAWWSIHGTVRCGICHPPASEILVAERQPASGEETP